MKKVNIDKIIEKIINENSVVVGMLPCNIKPDKYNQPQWTTITSLMQLDVRINKFMYENCNKENGDFPNYYFE